MPYPPADLADTIRHIYATLQALQSGEAQTPVFVLPTRSAIAASIRHDRLVSFIDGKAYKALKRHLTAKGMTPSEYRSRYGLPEDYPMVSPAYAKIRSRISKRIPRSSKAV
ncbi:MucR family transcriptional regulator [Methylobacterium sp. HMF5984]|uniref:MucR family transcriptional regulator n=1 Tax=Methylobacterium sp. HMF5984 TaxID=3367370 RepID=UPI0038520225